jgi:predicted alpha/beta superfamily hydrolase
MKKLIAFLSVLCILFHATAQLTIIVDEIPDNTPENDPIHIAGDFQGWDPGSIAHQLTEDTDLDRYHITLPAGTGDILFKFTRGSWEKVEADENGNFVPDRFYSSNNGDTIYLQILGWEDLDGNGGGQSTAAENVSIITDSFYMPEFDRYRRVWIYLPPDYETTGFDYPVLYMHDGQNCFDALTSFVGEWEVDETLNALHAEGDTGIIVVAIDNGGSFRIDEYTPWSHPTYGGGDGANYINFIVNTLKPYIDNNYRTLPGREHTGLMGSSLGGLVSTFGGIEHQDVFSKIGSFSPSYWFSDQAYTHVSSTGKQADLRIYQLMGGQEGGEHVDRMFAMEDTLHAAGFGANEVLSIEKADGQHSEWFWAREFEDAYLWLFRNFSTDTKEPSSNLTAFHIYPNPADSQLNLEFYLKKSDQVSVEIIDSSGTFKKAVYSNTLQSGKHHLNMNIKKWGLAPGVYFCRVYSGEFSNTLKFIVAE